HHANRRAVPLTSNLLLVGNCRASWAVKVNDFEVSEADFRAPPAKIRRGIVKGIAELNQHVQRHQQSEDVLATSIVNKGFDGYESAVGCQGIVGRANQMYLLLEIPVVENHTHGDDLRLG